MNKLKIKSNQWLSRHVPLPTNPIPVLHKPFPISIPYEFTKNIIIIGDQLEGSLFFDFLTYDYYVLDL